MDQAQVQAQMP